MDTPSKCSYDGNTCLLFLIQCQNLQLSKIIINHECQKQQLQYYDANCKHKEKISCIHSDNSDSNNGENENSANSDDNDDSAKVSNGGDNTNNCNHPAVSSNTTATNIGLVTTSNANGISCINALTNILNTENQLKNEIDRKDWEELLEEMKHHEQKEKVIVNDKKLKDQKENNNYRELQSMIQQEQEGRQRRARVAAVSRRADNITTSARGDWRYYPDSIEININDDSGNDTTDSTSRRYNTYCTLLKLLWRKLQCLIIVCFSIVLFFATIYLLTSFFFGRRFISL